MWIVKTLSETTLDFSYAGYAGGFINRSNQTLTLALMLCWSHQQVTWIWATLNWSLCHVVIRVYKCWWVHTCDPSLTLVSPDSAHPHQTVSTVVCVAVSPLASLRVSLTLSDLWLTITLSPLPCRLSRTALNSLATAACDSADPAHTQGVKTGSWMTGEGGGRCSVIQFE